VELIDQLSHTLSETLDKLLQADLNDPNLPDLGAAVDVLQGFSKSCLTEFKMEMEMFLDELEASA
jgi:hypothetical protein